MPLVTAGMILNGGSLDILAQEGWLVTIKIRVQLIALWRWILKLPSRLVWSGIMSP